MNEFEVIKKFFIPQLLQRKDVTLGIGDDAAIVKTPSDHDLIITIDTLIEGVHFPQQTAAFDIGYKALAVNLSDLAAMGATPAWITLALTIPDCNESWLKDFSNGLFSLATKHHIQLIGGDITRGHLSITIQAQGFTPTNQALRRDSAKPGDYIYVTNTLGDAAAAITLLKQNCAVPNELLERLNRPEPRIATGEQLRGIANAAIDISDGLAADLQHILEKSQLGAKLYIDRIPLSKTLLNTVSYDEAIAFALNGGDDYELCFTASKNNTITQGILIGEITTDKTLDLCFTDGKKYNKPITGYRHF